jgi:hypothetical protein
MANDENLKGHEFEPGQSGNPTGRPRGTRNLSTILRRFLEEPVEVLIDNVKTKKPFQEVIVRNLLKNAAAGDTKAINTVWDRVEGKAPQYIDVTTDGEPLTAQQHVVEFKDYSGQLPELNPKRKAKRKPKKKPKQ